MDSSLTEKLQRVSDGDLKMAEDLLRQIMPELHRIAIQELRRECNIVHTQPTELINE